MTSSPCGSFATFRRSRSIRANGSDSPDSSRTGQRMAGQWAIRASVRSGRAGRVERVAEAHQREIGRRRLGRGQAGHPSAEGVAADRDVGLRRDHEVEGRQRVLGLALGQVDGRRVDATSAQALDERGHARRGPARSVAEVAACAHLDSVAARWVVRLGGSWADRVMAGQDQRCGHPRCRHAPEAHAARHDPTSTAAPRDADDPRRARDGVRRPARGHRWAAAVGPRRRLRRSPWARGSSRGRSPI